MSDDTDREKRVEAEQQLAAAKAELDATKEQLAKTKEQLILLQAKRADFNRRKIRKAVASTRRVLRASA